MFWTIVFSVLILAAVVGVIVRFVRNKQKGITSCGCGCDACAAKELHNSSSH